MASEGGTPLIQMIEYDWSLVIRCPACGHTARWGAEDLVARFRDQLRAPLGQVAAAIAGHCGERPVVYSLQGAGMGRWQDPADRVLSEPWTFRDQRLRRFLVHHGLPMVLADERQAIADAWRAA